MTQRSTLNPTAKALRVLFGLPPALLRRLASTLTIGATPAGTGRAEEALARVEAARTAGLIDAKPNTDRWARQVLAAANGEPVFPANGTAADDDPDCRPVPVADLAPVLLLGYTPEAMPSAARVAAPSEVLYVRRGKNYRQEKPSDNGEQRFRRVPHGKRFRYVEA